MKKLGKAVGRFLTVIIALLVLGTVGILLYPKYGEQLGLEEKVAEIFPDSTEVAEDETVTDEKTEVSTEEHWEASTEEKTVDKPKLSRKQQEEIHRAYENIIKTMGYDKDAVLFYDRKTINNKDYWAFQIIDGEGNTFEYLLLSEINTNILYWCDSDNQIGQARSTDVLYSSNPEGKEEVSYKDDTWEDVFKAYMTALLENANLEEAESYRDSSYYYKARVSEIERKKNVEEAFENQKALVDALKEMQKQKETGRLLSIDAKYEVLEQEEMEDEEGASWIDISVHVKLLGEKRDEIQQEDFYYIVSLRRYDYGWRVATIIRE